MNDIVELARERIKHIKDDSDAVLIDMLVTDNERLRAALREIVSVWNDDSTDIIMDTLIREAREVLEK